MPLPSPLPISFSGTAMARTFARVETAAQYALPFTGLRPAQAIAEDWSRLLIAQDAPALTELIQNRHVTPYPLLNDEDKAHLRALALKTPDLRAALQEGAAQIERSIGVSMPLHIRVYASGETVSGPLRGISLFLNEGNHDDDAAAEGSAQVFEIAPRAQTLPTPGTGVVRDLKNPAHSPELRGHIGERVIRELAPLRIPGDRILPLSSPSRVFLNNRSLTRVGHFTFLGIPPALSIPALNLGSLRKFEDQVDVLCLAGAISLRPEIAAEIIGTLRPRITLAAGVQTHLYPSGNLGIFGVIAPKSEAWLDLNPRKDTVTITADDDSEWRSSGYSRRAMDRLESVRARVTRSVFGDILTDRRDWRWSQSILNGAIPQALRYLIFLQNNPDQAVSLATREDMLIRIIGEMIEPLSIPGADVDHIEAFRELLLQCGLLESQTGG